MRLSELPPAAQVTVVRDGEFHNLGFLFDDLPDKLLFVEGQQFVSAARAAHGRRAILCPPELADFFPDVEGLATAREPRLAFFCLQQYLVGRDGLLLDEGSSAIHPSARIHPRAWIAEHDVSIGPNTLVDANAVIGERTQIGAGVHIRAGAVLGREGFQAAHYRGGIRQLAHGGGVLVEDSVQIFATRSLGPYGVFRQMTTLGEHARIGNGAFVSHNVQVGRPVSSVRTAPSMATQPSVMTLRLAPAQLSNNLLNIGARAQVSLGAVVIRSVPPDTRVTSPTALEHRRMLRHMASITRAP